MNSIFLFSDLEVLNSTDQFSHNLTKTIPLKSQLNPLNSLLAYPQKKYFNVGLINSLRPGEIFKPIANKFHNIIDNFHGIQPNLNNYNNIGSYGSGITKPLSFLEILSRKAQNLYTNAHGAVFGTGYLSETDYPFAIRKLDISSINGTLKS